MPQIWQEGILILQHLLSLSEAQISLDILCFFLKTLATLLLLKCLLLFLLCGAFVSPVGAFV